MSFPFLHRGSATNVVVDSKKKGPKSRNEYVEMKYESAICNEKGTMGIILQI
jgi:hypothetical protein